MPRLIAALLAIVAGVAGAAPFAQVDVNDSLADFCDYVNATLGESFTVPVEVDPIRGRPENGYRICKADTDSWPVSGSVEVAFRSRRSGSGLVSAYTTGVLPRGAPEEIHLAAATEGNPMSGAPSGIAWGDVDGVAQTSVSTSAISTTIPAGATLVAFLWYNERTGLGASVSGGSGASWSQQGTTFNAGTANNPVYRVFMATNVTGGDTPTFTATMNGAGEDYPSLVVVSVTGLDNSGTYLTRSASIDSSVSGSDSISAGAMTFSGTAFAIACIQNEYTDGTPSAGTGFTNVSSTGWNYGTGIYGGRIIYAAGQSTGVNMLASPGSGSTAPHDIIAVALKEAAGGGGTTRGMPFGDRGTAFNGGRTFTGIMGRPRRRPDPRWARLPSGVIVPRHELRA